MAKQWKKMKGYYFDIGNRDAPCIIFNNFLYIGDNNSTHAYLVQKAIYGMDSFEDYYDEDNYYTGRYDKINGLSFKRSNIEKDFDEDEIIYGHLCGSNIYWDVWSSSISISKMRIIIKKIGKTEYNHYRISGKDDERKAIMLTRKQI